MSDTLPPNLTLDECISYALQNQVTIRQAQLDQQITDQDVKASLSAWLPQIRTEYNLQHNLKLPVSFFPDVNNPDGPRRAVTLGLKNTSNVLFQADQIIYSNDVMLASRAARYSRLRASQNTENEKINLIVAVSKAYYDILITQEQLKVVESDQVRIERLLKDAYSQYESGVTDKIDYKRASITLNNSRAQKRSITEALKYKYTYLKQLTGLPQEKKLGVSFDSSGVQQELFVDTLQALKYENRIEYQLLQTQNQLQLLNAKYYQWGFAPTVSAFINYNFVYLNDNFGDLYSRNFPNSAVGLKVAVPLFQGTRRLHNLQKSRLQLKRLQLDMDYLKYQVSTEYEQSMALYKSNLNEYQVQGENLAVAREVYNIVKLQYDEGIKTYLEVITSETDLQTAQINYLNALFNVLSSKLEVQKALGNLNGNK